MILVEIKIYFVCINNLNKFDKKIIKLKIFIKSVKLIIKEIIFFINFVLLILFLYNNVSFLLLCFLIL